MKREPQPLLMRCKQKKRSRFSDELKFVLSVGAFVIVIGFVRTTAQEFYVKGKSEVRATEQVSVGQSGKREVLYSMEKE